MTRRILKIVLSLTGSQCMFFNIEVMWTDFFALKVSLAAVFCNVVISPTQKRVEHGEYCCSNKV